MKDFLCHLSRLKVCLFVLISLAAEKTYTQTFPSSCPSKDLELVSAALTGGDICNSCAPGDSLTRTLTLGINNKTGSTRNAFAFWATLEITHPDNTVATFPIARCSGPIPPTGPYPAAYYGDFGTIKYKCGDALRLLDLHLAWTDAANNAKNQCSYVLSHPSTIDPKCGTLPSIEINAGINGRFTSVTNLICFGGATGAIDLTPFGGTPFASPKFYTYSWSTSDGTIPAGQQTNQDLTGLTKGHYTVRITDSLGCYIDKTVEVTAPSAALSAAETHVNVVCFGGATGSIDLTPSGGTSPYAYAWTASNGGVIPAGQSASQDLTGLVAGTYDVVVTDANGSSGGCRATKTINITQPTAALSSTETHINVACYGGSTGSIDLTPSGGTSPYSYSWTASNGGVIPAGQSANQDLTNLVAGTYDVVITDANGSTGGCRATKSVTISQPAAALSSSETHVNVVCSGGATGSIDLTPSGGTSPYSYAWTASNGGVIPAGQSANQDLTGLVAGTYNVVITDANGSTGGCRATKSVNITQPAAVLSSTETHVNVVCFGGATGSIDLSPSGGTAPYTYAWSASNGGVIPAGQSANQDLTGLVAGTYDVVITDANGSTGGCRATKSITISQPAAALSSTETHVNVVCFNAATGSIDLTPSGGTSPYAYSWTASNGGAIPAGQSTSQDLTGLIAGTYDVVITDANGTTGGCRTTKSVTITQPSGPVDPPATEIVPITCTSTTFSVRVTNAKAGTTYNCSQPLNNNSKTFSPITAVNNGDEVVFSGLTFGDGYSITASNGSCVSAPANCGVQNLTARSAMQSESLIQSEPIVKAYPNPFSDKIKFVVTSAVAGKGNLEVYNMMGQRVKTVYQGFIISGTQTFEMSLPRQQVANLIYILRIGDKKMSGKILQINQ